jgi:hypothetical protein
MLKRTFFLTSLLVLQFAAGTEGEAGSPELALGGSTKGTGDSLRGTDGEKFDGVTGKRKRAGASGKRIGGATKGMPDVKRIEGKEQCRVIAMVGKRIIATTPVRNSTRDKAAGVLSFQSRWLRNDNPNATERKAVTEAHKSGAVKFALQWLAGTKWVDHKAAAKA